MPESFVNVTEGVGKKLHTWQRTIGANTVEDEVVIAGEPNLAGYFVGAGSGLSLATAASHPIQIMAGAALRVYLRRLVMYQVAAATAAGFYDFLLLRLTTAGTGGVVLTPNAMDPADAAAGAVGMSLPTVKGTEGLGLWRGSVYLTQTISASLGGGEPAKLLDLDFDKLLRGKPPIIAAGAANGIVLKNSAGIAGATVAIIAYISEANF